MTDALTLITRLGREGKTPLEIARELHSSGVTDRRGKAITPAVVEGFLRFARLPVPKQKSAVIGAVWGSGGLEEVVPEVGDGHAPEASRKKKPKNRWHPHKYLSDSQKAEITRLYHQEHMTSGAIAEKLGIPFRRINPFCGYLAGFSLPPGEFEEFVDAQGHRVLKCPPGYARGVIPQRNVRPTQGGW